MKLIEAAVESQQLHPFIQTDRKHEEDRGKRGRQHKKRKTNKTVIS